MIGAFIFALLQAVATPDAPAPEAAPAAQEETSRSSNMMTCDPWDRGTRTRLCRNAEGEVLRCRRERVLGSRFPQTICLTYQEDQQLTEDTRSNLDRQQRIPDGRAN